MDLINPLLISFLLLASMIIVHELGHYLVARRFGWNPRITIKTDLGLWSGIAVETDEQTIESLEEVPIAIKRLVMFGSAGCIGVFPILIASYLLDNVALLWAAVYALFYSISETLHVFDFFTLAKEDET